MRLTQQQLNRTLLLRQGLLHRRAATVAEVAGHLLGLQAQEVLPPYLSLAARLAPFDPEEVSRGLADASLVRLRTLRATLHLHRADDAVGLWPWLRPFLERAAARQPSAPTPEPLVQLPPRGTWGGHGGIVLEDLERWTGRGLAGWDVTEVVRRYLASYGPATAADLTTWSGVTGLRPVFARMTDERLLVRHEDAASKPLWDLPDAPLADPDEPAPVRLLGTYDNLWLSHAARDRVTTPDARAHWQGPNGASAATVFVDGWLAGLWTYDGTRVAVETFRPLAAAERADLDAEVARLEALLASRSA